MELVIRVLIIAVFLVAVAMSIGAIVELRNTKQKVAELESKIEQYENVE